MENMSGENNTSGAMPDEAGGAGNAPAISLHSNAAPAASQTDLLGDVKAAYAGFNPEIHAVDNEGKPRFTSDGNYAKKRGRKSGSKATIKIEGGKLVVENATNETAQTDYKAAAAGSVMLLTTTLQMIFGAHWQAEKPEFENMSDNLALYYQKNGIVDLPPGYLVAFSVAAYAAPRVSHPETVSRWHKIKVATISVALKMRGWFAK